MLKVTTFKLYRTRSKCVSILYRGGLTSQEPLVKTLHYIGLQECMEATCDQFLDGWLLNDPYIGRGSIACSEARSGHSSYSTPPIGPGFPRTLEQLRTITNNNSSHQASCSAALTHRTAMRSSGILMHWLHIYWRANKL